MTLLSCNTYVLFPKIRHWRPRERCRLETTELRGAAGFQVLEVLITVTVIGMVTAGAVPAVLAARQRFETNSGAREIASAIRTARLQAVTMRTTFLVRFNCPVAGQYRVVQLTSDATIDDDANRCRSANYPYPDTNTALPNGDGPLLTLRSGLTLGTIPTLRATSDGRIAPLTGSSPVSVSVSGTGSHNTATLSISASGRVDVP